MAKLSIIVTCTGRKRAIPATNRTVRTLPQQEASKRCGQWLRQVSQPDLDSHPIPLRDLYRGELWQQSLKLIGDAEKDHSVDAYVASAGLGLQPIESRNQPYAATFSQGHPDTVAPGRDTSEWWQRLRDSQEHPSLPGQAPPLSELVHDHAVLVLAGPYARAMHLELIQLGQTGKDVLLIGGWTDIPGMSRIRADRDLRSTLKGTNTSLLVRMARQWLAMWDGGPVYSFEISRRWQTWVAEARQVEHYHRTRLSDHEVLNFIVDLREKSPRITATTALRKFRDSGFACEQKRFGSLFRQATSET